MELKNQVKKYENWIIAFAAMGILAVFAGCRFDYFYDLNDDVLMKDILAGVYTGTPEGHNIQMLWLISAFISLFYRLAGGIPWDFFVRLPLWLFFPDFKKESEFLQYAIWKVCRGAYGRIFFWRSVFRTSDFCTVYGNLHPSWRDSGVFVFYHG